MIPRIAFPSLAVCLVGVVMSFTPKVAEARHGFHGGGFHGGGFRGGFYGGGFGRGFYGGGFGRGFYGGGIYAGRGFYGGYRGFYPRFYGGYYPRYYGGFYPRYYGGYYMSPGYYGGGYGYGGYGYGNYGYGSYGNCTCGTYGVTNGGYVTASVGGIANGIPSSQVVRSSTGTSNPLLAYYLKNNPYTNSQVPSATIVSNPYSSPVDKLPMEKPYARYLPAALTEQSSVVLPPTPKL